MEEKKDRWVMFILLGFLVVASLYTSINIDKTGQSVRDSSVSLCKAQWYCIDDDTMAFRGADCRATKVTSCGTNEICMNNYCRPIGIP